jgi:hypothetical protein
LEVKINREIRDYTESMFFGLSLRQFIFSALALVIAVGLYFILKPYVGTETVSWMCILGAAPCAALGFITYHGMTAEQFLWAWLRSEFLDPKEIKFEPVNIYYEALKDTIETHENGGRGVRKRKPKRERRHTPPENAGGVLPSKAKEETAHD